MSDVKRGKLHPAAYKHVLALSQECDEAVAAVGLDAKLGELVKIRVSKPNGCAFCLRMHTRDALAAGESTDRLAVVMNAWNRIAIRSHYPVRP